LTLEQLEQTLPNGLHDAKLRSLSRDFHSETLTLNVSVLVGLPSDPVTRRDGYRDAFITFTGVKVCAIEAPDVSSAFQTSGSLFFRIDRSEVGAFAPELEASLPKDIHRYSLFILDWLSSIHIAVLDAIFAWTPS
jgi:hypothetical protein